jgi:hypothetical protein
LACTVTLAWAAQVNATTVKDKTKHFFNIRVLSFVPSKDTDKQRRRQRSYMNLSG